MFRILIIDDTKSVHAFVKSLLDRSAEVKCESVMNGQEAVDKLKVDSKFDLIFLDWEMPVLNGPGTFSEFKKIGLKVPVVMMTTKNAMEDIQTMLNMGVAEYLIKPFTIDILFEKIEFATGRSLPYAA